MNLINQYLFDVPKSYQDILVHLIKVIERIDPEFMLLFKYGVPYFYYKRKMFCYLVYNKKNDFVDVGFAKGYQLKLHQKKLIGVNRNTVKSLRYYTLSDVENNILEEVIKEAINLYN